MARGTFYCKEHRDAAWRKEGKRGRRYSMRNQQLHPMYLRDAAEHGLAEAAADRGFGNTEYRTVFGVIYCIGG